METKDHSLREEDICIPINEGPPSPPRFAIVVEILSVEQPWAPEEALFQILLQNSKDSNENEGKTTQSTASKATIGHGVFEPLEKPVSTTSSSVEKVSILGSKNAPTKKASSSEKEAENEDGVAISTTNIDINLAKDALQLSKASFSFQFPGFPLPPPDIGLEIGEAIQPEMPPLVPPPMEHVEGETELDEPEEPMEATYAPAPPPTTRFINFPAKEFDVESNYSLWHRLLQESLLMTMYWTSPSGANRLPFAQAHVDLFPVLALREGKLECTCKLEKIPELVVVEEKPPIKAKKGAKGSAKEKVEKKEAKPKDEKDKRKTKTKKGVEPEVLSEEVLPTLLEGAELKIALSTTNPFWSEDDILNGVVVEFVIGTVIRPPPKVAEFGLKALSNKDEVGDPFSYILALEFPGFRGTKWWDEIKYLTLDEKNSIAQIRIEGGKATCKEHGLELENKASIIPPIGSIEEMLRAIRKTQEAKVTQEAITWESQLAKEAKSRLEKLEDEEFSRKLLHSESIVAPDDDSLTPKDDTIMDTKAIVTWPDYHVVKRFLPGRATFELKELVKTGHIFRGEIARVVKPFSSFKDAHFGKYHGCFYMNLSPFLEEGCYAFDLRVLFSSYSLLGTRAGIPLIQPEASFQPPFELTPTSKPSSPKPSKAQGKKTPKIIQPMEQDDDPPLPICVDPDNPLPNNAWQLSQAFMDIKVHTSRPMEPVWKAPPEPDMSIEVVIPPRPKQPSVYDAIQMAMNKFSKFVEFVGVDLIDMHHDLVTKELYEEKVGDIKGANASTNKRFETKGEIRKKMIRNLQKQGIWHDIREEMKTKVLKVAATMYRENKRNALDIGKFEFCNNLYITLSEVIFNTLKNLIEKRKGEKQEIVDDLARLRQHADEYEAEKDYRSASRCQQERLLGDNIHDPNIWFEYGCFCMRVKPRDQGKAEECWREAITLNKNHIFSLQALGCLMWHRGYLAQAEVLFRNAINLHTEEEHINWILASQVYAAQGKKDNERSCLKRAEVLYLTRRDAQNTYSPPHQLLSPLWGFPFGLSYQILSSQNTSGLFIDSALLLLDLHLPKEAELIMGLETEVYTCTLDNKWCRARIAELNGNLEQGRGFIQEAIKINKENPTSWLLLGHMTFNYEPPMHFTNALQNNVYREAIDSFTKYKRYMGDDEQYKFVYLELGYSFSKLGAWDEARKIFLKGCTILPTSPAMWLAAGMAFYFLGNLNNAELALVEGNVLDTSNFKIWAYLTLICLREERHEEAEVSFQQGLKCVVDPNLLVTIAEGFARIGNFRDAEIAYQGSLNAKESSAVRFQLAEMYFKEGKFLFAIPNYEKIVKAHDVTLEDKSVSISRLTEMQVDNDPKPPINRHLKDLSIEI